MTNENYNGIRLTAHEMWSVQDTSVNAQVICQWYNETPNETSTYFCTLFLLIHINTNSWKWKHNHVVLLNVAATSNVAFAAVTVLIIVI